MTAAHATGTSPGIQQIRTCGDARVEIERRRSSGHTGDVIHPLLDAGLEENR